MADLDEEQGAQKDGRHGERAESSAMGSSSKIVANSRTQAPEKAKAKKFFLSGQRRGVAICVLGCLLVTPDAALTRLSRSKGGTTWTIVFWKLVSQSAFLFGYAFRNMAVTLENPKLMLLLGLLSGLVPMGLTIAVLFTYAANALFAYSVDPLRGAILGWLFLKDVLPVFTIVAILGAFCALVLM